MKWQGKRQSSNVDDRRGQSSGRMGGGGMNPMMLGFLFKLLFSKTGLIIVGIVTVISFATGTNPLTFIENLIGGGGQGFTTTNEYIPTAEEDPLAEYSTTILADTELIGNELIENYREPTLVLS